MMLSENRFALFGIMLQRAKLTMTFDYKSPYDTFVDYCKKGQLAYQVCRDDGQVIFYPRIAAPLTGSTNLEWRVSKGLGTVHSTTVVHRPKAEPYNVALIDLDEGFRMMSRVENIPPMEVRIGMRVKVRMTPGDDKQPDYPVFDPCTDEA